MIDYSGSVDGKKFDGGTAEKQTLLLGSHTFIPGFEEQVEGMSVGEERDINVKFPDDYHAENLKGKDSVFPHKAARHPLQRASRYRRRICQGRKRIRYPLPITERILKSIFPSAKNAAADTDVENRLLQMIVDKCKVEIPSMYD